MLRRVIWMQLFVIMLLFVQVEVSHANRLKSLQADDVNILFIYGTKDGSPSANVRKIEMLLTHFTESVAVYSQQDVTKKQVEEATHIVYFGETVLQMTRELKNAIGHFSGTLIGIGENINTTQPFQRMIIGEDVIIDRFVKHSSGEEKRLNPIESIKQIHLPSLEKNNIEVLYDGKRNDKSYPLLVGVDDAYYFNIVTFRDSFEYMFAEFLHEVIPNNHPNEHLGFIQITNVHPMSEPEKLKEVSNYLEEKEIPYTIAVTPVYIEPDSSKSVYFTESSDLLQVLQSLQQKGVSIIAHGYKHDYYRDSFYEGSEFWDVKNDQMIIDGRPISEVEPVLQQEDFTNEQLYKDYIEHIQEQETEYIEERLEHSIYELLRFDLYPVGFQPPYNTMSDNGYQIASEHFTTFIGQVQYTDRTGKQVGAPPYITSSSQLHGMNLYPESVGLYEGQRGRTEEKISNLLSVRDSVIGTTYDVHLGKEHLVNLIDLYEKVPNIHWLDFATEDSTVISEKATIHTDENGKIEITNDLTWFNHWKRNTSQTTFEKTLWAVTIVVFVFVSMFIAFTLHLRTRVRKRLFMERK